MTEARDTEESPAAPDGAVVLRQDANSESQTGLSARPMVNGDYHG